MRPVLVGLLVAVLAPPAAASPPTGHCAPIESFTAVQGDPGAWRIVTGHGTTIARTPPPARASGGPPVVIEARALVFDADGDTVGTVMDTVVVEVGTTVRFLWVNGFHTVTNGRDSGDPTAGQSFDYVLWQDAPVWDSTFTAPTNLDFFCFIHEPQMAGHLIVTASNTTPPGATPTRAAFSRPPAPNPTGGAVAFAVTLPAAADTDIAVLDVTGRRVARIHRGPLGPGEHAFRWSGGLERGGPAPPGRYLVTFRAGSTTLASRAFTIVR